MDRGSHLANKKLDTTHGTGNQNSQPSDGAVASLNEKGRVVASQNRRSSVLKNELKTVDSARANAAVSRNSSAVTLLKTGQTKENRLAFHPHPDEQLVRADTVHIDEKLGSSRSRVVSVRELRIIRKRLRRKRTNKRGRIRDVDPNVGTKSKILNRQKSDQTKQNELLSYIGLKPNVLIGQSSIQRLIKDPNTDSPGSGLQSGNGEASKISRRVAKTIQPEQNQLSNDAKQKKKKKKKGGGGENTLTRDCLASRDSCS
jgi:hypothetical protein